MHCNAAATDITGVVDCGLRPRATFCWNVCEVIGDQAGAKVERELLRQSMHLFVNVVSSQKGQQNAFFWITVNCWTTQE